MSTIAQQLAQRFAKLDYRRTPEANRHSMRRLLLDYIGVGIAGSQTESGVVGCEFALVQGGKPEVTLIGSNGRVPMASGALANAISSHSIELDDIDILALFHNSPPVFSAALAAAEATGASGKDLLAALAAGCELMERVSKAANNSLRNRGFHTTPTCGVFGATVAAAKLLRLTPVKLVSAFGLAGAQASGLMEMYGPSMQKRFNPGPAARNGVTAALMAKLGFTGADTIFEGERGFLRTFTDKHDASQLTADLNGDYELNIEFKPYSCARPIHNAIDCALIISKRDKPDLTRIKGIQVARHSDWAHYHKNPVPNTYHEAQVSLPYSAAVAFKEGQALLAQYTARKLKDPLLKKLSDLTTISVDDTLPRGVSCHMTVTMNDGKQYVAQVDYPKGSIENPMTDEEITGKFMSLASPVVGEKKAAAIAERVWTIDKCADVGELMRMTVKPRPAPARKSASRSRGK